MTTKTITQTIIYGPILFTLIAAIIATAGATL